MLISKRNQYWSCLIIFQNWILLLIKELLIKRKLCTVLEDTPTHLPDMRFVDIIARPIVVVSMCGEKWDLLDYMMFRQHIILKLPKSWLVKNHQDLHGQNSKGPYNRTSLDSIGLPFLLYSLAVFQVCFIDTISDKGNNIWSFNLLDYWDRNTKKYLLVNVDLVAPKMWVTLTHEYFKPEACTYTKLSLIGKGYSKSSWKYHISRCFYNSLAFWLLWKDFLNFFVLKKICWIKSVEIFSLD